MEGGCLCPVRLWEWVMDDCQVPAQVDDSIIITVISISIHGCRIFYPSNGCLRHTMDE